MITVKRILVSACALGAALNAAIPETFANTQKTVQSGDTLWKIATAIGTTTTSARQRSAVAAAIVSTAESLVGTPYVWGGQTTTGFDCSGFTQYVFAKHGITLPRISTEQFGVGTPISLSALQVGDLVFYADTWKAGVSHVGIYIGNGQFIEESSGKGRVVIVSMENPYYKAHYAGAKRVF